MKFVPDIIIANYTEQRYNIPNVNVLLVPDSLICNDSKKLCKPKYFLLIIGEAHNMKEYTGKKNKTIYHLKTTHKFALTGTLL